jgi:Zn2+/Cd2+-exporting ATPase
MDNSVEDGVATTVDLPETEGRSLIFVARKQEFIGWIGMQDQTRTDAKDRLTALRSSGARRIALVSSDR